LNVQEITEEDYDFVLEVISRQAERLKRKYPESNYRDINKLMHEIVDLAV